MANMSMERETLRALADEGNETALDRLADLADTAGDLEELSELLDEGSMHSRPSAHSTRGLDRRPA